MSLYTHYVAFDLHKNYSFVTAMNEKGQIVNRQAKLPNCSQNILNFLEPFPHPKICVEAGSNWYWFIDLLQDYDYDAALSHPKKTKAIASAKIMTDKIGTHFVRALSTNYHEFLSNYHELFVVIRFYSWKFVFLQF